MFSGASNFVNNVDKTTLFIFLVSIFFLIGITATMIYFVVRYNKNKSPKSEHIEGNITLEVVWTVIPVILVSVMFIYGWTNWKMLKSPPKNSFVITSTARMWSWSFKYPNGKVTDTLYVPVNKAVIVNVNSADVIHSLYIPAFRVKQDVVPGNKNFLWFIAEKEGTYDLFCAEYCGLRHAYMTSAVVAMQQDTFNSWYKASQEAVTATTGAAAKKSYPGQDLIKQNGCVACHSIDGSRIVGPSFKGIYGTKTAVLVNGKEEQVLVDDSYILESVYEPNAKIVKGFQPNLMQSFKSTLTKDQVKEIAEYIKSLK
ncbi:MAG TPA: cytochrome c oxidase subunit II [Bacteroidales bacterium]